MIELRNAQAFAHIEPSLGGGVLRFVCLRGDTDASTDTDIQSWQAILRDLPEPQAARQTGCYPLVPYSNRIARGHFTFAEKAVRLRLNNPPEPHSIHGVGWQQPWQLIVADSQHCVMQLVHCPNEDWPWHFTAEQVISLTGRCLTLSLHLHNTDTDAFPAGLGWHPFFLRNDNTQLTMPASAVALMGKDKLPSATVPVPAAWNFSAGKQLTGLTLDNLFCHTSGVDTRITQTDHRITLSRSQNLCHTVVFTPPDTRYLAVEPVSHMHNAMNNDDPASGGMVTLLPGQTLSAQLSIAVQFA